MIEDSIKYIPAATSRGTAGLGADALIPLISGVGAALTAITQQGIHLANTIEGIQLPFTLIGIHL